MTALQGRLEKYTALVSRVEQNRYGYWSVTYSVAPGVDMTVTLATLGISPSQARLLAGNILLATTGQEVRQ